MASSSRPKEIAVRAYQVGFGDCFLLSFRYAKSKDRHVLIDFGTTGTPDGRDKERLAAIAQDIRTRCGGKLAAVVATHRHKDHISGFDPSGKGAPGKVIASCNPEVVLQPWTEDPKAAKNATGPTKKHFVNFGIALAGMQTVADGAAMEANLLGGRRASTALKALGDQVAFIGEDNLANKKAVVQLQTMGKRHVYAYAGSSAGLGSALPGVKVHVLGPPTLKQTDAIRKQRRSDPDEFWQLQAGFWGLMAHSSTSGDGEPLFDPALAMTTRPPEVRWFIRRAAQTRGEELLGLVRSLDKAMNNTSLILVFEVGKTRLLFPGDAQIENWAYALEQPKVQTLLKSVQLYKVGHHGSRNATPKRLWALFDNRSTQASPGRLQSVLSTMADKHGDEDSRTDVPRKTLVAALRKETTFTTTESLKGKGLCQSEEVVVGV